MPAGARWGLFGLIAGPARRHRATWARQARPQGTHRPRRAGRPRPCRHLLGADGGQLHPRPRRTSSSGTGDRGPLARARLSRSRSTPGGRGDTRDLHRAARRGQGLPRGEGAATPIFGGGPSSRSPSPARPHQLRVSMRPGRGRGQRRARPSAGLVARDAGWGSMGTLPPHRRPCPTPPSPLGEGSQAPRRASPSKRRTPRPRRHPLAPRGSSSIPARAAPHRAGQEIAGRSPGRGAHGAARSRQPGDTRDLHRAARRGQGLPRGEGAATHLWRRAVEQLTIPAHPRRLRVSIRPGGGRGQRRARPSARSWWRGMPAGARWGLFRLKDQRGPRPSA
jgi:hypothetical protein